MQQGHRLLARHVVGLVRAAPQRRQLGGMGAASERQERQLDLEVADVVVSPAIGRDPEHRHTQPLAHPRRVVELAVGTKEALQGLALFELVYAHRVVSLILGELEHHLNIIRLEPRREGLNLHGLLGLPRRLTRHAPTPPPALPTAHPPTRPPAPRCALVAMVNREELVLRTLLQPGECLVS